jgi:polyhydroxyalkanoate synthase subunit PhaE
MVIQDEWLRQWQSLLSSWNPIAGFGFAPAARGGVPGADQADPYSSLADAFSAAMRGATEAAASGSPDAGTKASALLSDFLRARFADFSAFAAIGPMREHQQRWERMLQAQQRADQTRATLARLWSDALRDAARNFARRALEPGRAATEPAALYNEWIEGAEEAYARMAHGEAFCSAQAELLNALSALRTELQTAFEIWAKELDLPTRTELNRLHQAVKALRAELAGLAAAPKAARSTASKPAASRTPARRAPAAAPRRGRRPTAKRRSKRS